MLKRSLQRKISGVVALAAGSLVIYLGDWLLGVKPELWVGLETFSYAWMADMFIVPLTSGIIVAILFGLGGKWLCYFPPLFIRVYSYFSYIYLVPVPEGAKLLTFPLWILVVILVVEAAAFGGVFGEILVKRTYGRIPADQFIQVKKGQDSSGADG